jgi:hypothetical protein
MVLGKLFYGILQMNHLEAQNLPWAFMDLEFDKFGFARKLVKYAVHLSKK